MGIVQPVLQAPPPVVVGHHVELGAVAGGQQHGLVHALDLAHRLQRAGDLLSSEYDLLANFDRCRVMVQPENVERHRRFGDPGCNSTRMISELMTQFLVCVHSSRRKSPLRND